MEDISVSFDTNTVSWTNGNTVPAALADFLEVEKKVRGQLFHLIVYIVCSPWVYPVASITCAKIWIQIPRGSLATETDNINAVH